jgi:mRNA interferase RelE/StbE
LRIKESAQKALRRLDRGARTRIWAAIAALEENPHPLGCAKLAGHDDLWRIRSGDYRVIYQIRESEMVVLVVRVGHRREAYRGM